MSAIWNVTLQAMHQDAARMERIASNLANVTTPGYRREILLQRPNTGLPADFASLVSTGGAVSLAESSNIAYDQRPGTLKPTGQPLDLALLGSGHLEVQTDQGAAFTRVGRFHLDNRGRVVNDQGHALLGDGGEIVLNSAAVSIDAQGNVVEGGRQVARVRVREFAPGAKLQSLGAGLYRIEGTPLATERSTQLRQGHLENANVDSAHEMVGLTQTMRHFESLQRAAQGLDDMLGTAIRKLGEF